MPPEVTCPACQHRFAGPQGAGENIACPRCGAALARTEVRPAERNVQAVPPGPAALATTVCPACGKAVPELCLLCPHCEEPLAERHRVRRAVSPLPLAVGCLLVVLALVIFLVVVCASL